MPNPVEGVAAVRSKTFEVLTISVTFTAGLVLVPEAAAYDPAPLCAYPDGAQAEARFTPSWSEPPDEPSMCAPREAPSIAFEAVIDADEARAALARARRLARTGRPNEALLALRVVERAFPDLADRVALEEAAYRMLDGADALACQAYARAAESPHRDVAARAEVGHVRCLLATGDRRAERAFEELRRRYPELPQANELTLLFAHEQEMRGEREEAARIYRQIDLTSPGTRWAAEARAQLDRLRAAGVPVRDLTLLQEVERADRLTSAGYYDEARAEVARLSALELPRALAQQLARSAARIARVEGRWDDARALLRQAGASGAEEAALEEQAQDLEEAVTARDEEEVRRDIRGITHGRPLSRQTTTRLFSVLEIAARGGLREVVDDVLRQIAHRDRIPPGLRFDAAILAAGTGDDALVADLFRGVRSHPSYGVAARYHYARTLERMRRVTEAREEYAQVIASDDRRLPYYALWARARMRATGGATTPTPQPVAVLAPVSVSCDDGPYTPVPEWVAGKTDELARSDDASCAPPQAGTFVPATEDGSEGSTDPIAEADAEASESEARNDARPAIRLTPEQIIGLLTPIAEQHGEAFPWIRRAIDLVRLGELRAATDELAETYVAWRDARGSGGINAGLVAVMRGAAPPRHRATPQTWRARRTLPASATATLARASAALGDHGLAIRFGGFDVAGPRPRAYEDIVEAAARRHGIEPELLFAVMRVESVYNPRIISYAGAIGLMQIMPRTGRLIAHRLGRDDFTTDDLLDPEVNIEFAAWYLASLIERFDGRLPLAIASYNGGPHNVRRWMRDCSDSMPLDAFLELIPFDQTHRYVRRVLTHYAAYRAQRGRPLTELDVQLPRVEPDPLAF